MPSEKTISKGVTSAQFEAFERACKSTQLTFDKGKEAALRLFCEAHGVEWPSTQQHGGRRWMGCPRCGDGVMVAHSSADDYECSSCGLHRVRTPQGWQDYEIVDGQRVERDHKNTGWGDESA